MIAEFSCRQRVGADADTQRQTLGVSRMQPWLGIVLGLPAVGAGRLWLSCLLLGPFSFLVLFYLLGRIQWISLGDTSFFVFLFLSFKRMEKEWIWGRVGGSDLEKYQREGKLQEGCYVWQKIKRKKKLVTSDSFWERKSVFCNEVILGISITLQGRSRTQE